MEWYQIVTMIVSVLSLPTIMALIWKDLWDRKKANSEKNQQARKEELRNEYRTVFKEEIAPIANQISQIDQNLKLVTEGTLSTLRSEILRCYYSCVDKGYRTDYDYQNIHELYEAYNGLHGNSFVHDVVNRFNELPTKEEIKKSGGAE